MAQDIDLDQLNGMERDAFAAALGPVFEHSPWIASQAWEFRPFAAITALHAAMMAVVADACEHRKLALLLAHPDLAGKAARAGDLTAESTREQAAAGLDQLTAEEYDRFHTLNAAYRERFGFPFIICVRNHNKAGILGAFERRLSNSTADEIDEALRQVAAITRLRLDDLILDNDRGNHRDNHRSSDQP